jgi:hypothetical protein
MVVHCSPPLNRARRVLMIIFNFAWISAVLTHQVGGDDGDKKGAAPITGAVTGEGNVQVVMN